MKVYKSILILFFALVLCLIPIRNSYSGPPSQPNTSYFLFETDSGNISQSRRSMFYFFDLRDRETFIQLTYPALDTDFSFTGSPATAHVQIFDVSNNCNENDFFDRYTPSDTHIYNMRDIQTNDGNPSGVVLPDGAYGIVTIVVESDFDSLVQNPFGNVRIIDNDGYEYRTNAQVPRGRGPSSLPISAFDNPFYSFNFNKEAGITYSDVVGITTLLFDSDSIVSRSTDSQDVANIFYPVDVDILDNTENIFSCRNVIFSCVNQQHPRYEELLENAGTASVASFDYGINEAITHSKEGELLCPGNNISEGIVKLTPLLIPGEVIDTNEANGALFNGRSIFVGYIGLNNGNGKGSFDSVWVNNWELRDLN